MVGASGAISGVLGAYMVRYPKNRVLVLIPLGFFTQQVKIPAILVFEPGPTRLDALVLCAARGGRNRHLAQ
jgi:hypothetical protein